MTWIQDINNCYGKDSLDKSCQVPAAVVSVVSGAAGIAVLIFTVMMCCKKQQVKPVSIVQEGTPHNGTTKGMSVSGVKPSPIQQAPTTGPKPDRPGQYYDRVTGQWVEDVDFSLEADGKILKVINPDPGGLPNIPYDEKNTTDVPMTSYQPTPKAMPKPQVVIPIHYAMRRQLFGWPPGTPGGPPVTHFPFSAQQRGTWLAPQAWPQQRPSQTAQTWSNHGPLIPQTSGYQYWGPPQQQQMAAAVPEVYGNFQDAYMAR